MKNEFFEYYQPGPEDYKKIWLEGLLVVDTNLLLDLYRLPEIARSELLAVISFFEQRLWIPYQVGMEFQRRRMTVIAAERKATEKAISDTNELLLQINKKVCDLELEKRGLGLETKPLLDSLEVTKSKITTAINAVHETLVDVATNDPIRDQVDILFSGKIGTPPTDQNALNAMLADAELRYDRKIPPGYSDAPKEKNISEAAFLHGGLLYQRQYGDLILWKQIIEKAKATSTKSVLFVTSDKKEDWWWRENGRRLGPRPELLREIFQEAGVERFWMYTSDQFIEQAKAYTKAVVSPETVSELKAISHKTDDGRLDQQSWGEGVRPDGTWGEGIYPIPSSRRKHCLDVGLKWIDEKFKNIDKLYINDEHNHVEMYQINYAIRFSFVHWSNKSSLHAHVGELAVDMIRHEPNISGMRTCIFLVVEFREYNEIISFPNRDSLVDVARSYGAELEFIVGYVIRDRFMPLQIDISNDIRLLMKEDRRSGWWR